jgi:hypothetical protein
MTITTFFTVIPSVVLPNAVFLSVVASIIMMGEGIVRTWLINGATALSITTFSVMTLSVMTLSIMTLSIMTLSIMTLSITFKKSRHAA